MPRRYSGDRSCPCPPPPNTDPWEIITAQRVPFQLSTTFAASSRTPAGGTGCWLTRHLRPAAMSHHLQREAAPDEGKVSKQVTPSDEQHHPQDSAADVVEQESPIGHPADTGHKRGECPHDGHEPGQHDGEASVALVETVRAVQIVRFEEPYPAAPAHAGSDRAPNPVIRRIPGHRGHCQHGDD